MRERERQRGGSDRDEKREGNKERKIKGRKGEEERDAEGERSMFLGLFSGVTPVFAARSTCHVGGRLVTSNHFCLPPCLSLLSCCTRHFTHQTALSLDVYI